MIFGKEEDVKDEVVEDAEGVAVEDIVEKPKDNELTSLSKDELIDKIAELAVKNQRLENRIKRLRSNGTPRGMK